MSSAGVAELRMALDRRAFARAVGLESLDPWQEQVLHSESGRILLNCCRQSGKSTISAILALHRALCFPNSLVLVLAPALRQSQELFQKLGGFYSALGEPMRKYGERKLSLELANGSRVVTLPGSERTIRGFSGAALLLVDEAARVDDALYYAVRPMLAVSGGELVMLSTPFGKRGIFHSEWTEGVGWQRFEIPASECPRISPAFLEEERRTLPNRMFEQEYCCKFVERDDAAFSFDEISNAMSDEVEPLFGEAR